MFSRSGRLAAALGGVSHGMRRVGAAASLLILALATASCSVILDRAKGVRLFEVVLKLWELLPEQVPTSPYEVFVEVVGEDFGEKFADFLQSMIKINLDFGVFSKFFELAFLFLGAFIGFYVLKYFSRVNQYINERGWAAVKSGGTEIVPPLQYIFKRLLVVVVLVVPMVLLVPLAMEFVGDSLSGMAFALYEGAGTSMESAIEEIFVRMLDGIQVWMFLLTFLLNFVVGMAFICLLAWRYITVPFYTLLIYFHAPQYLNGEKPGELSKPLERALFRVLVLVVTWFFIIIGPLIVLELGVAGFPMAIAITVSMVLASVAPWIIFRWGVFGVFPAAKVLAQQIAAPVDVFSRTPGVGVTEAEHVSFWRRAWERMPRWVRGTTEFGVEVARHDPTYGPVITTVETAYEKARRMDAKSAGREFAEVIYREPPSGSGGRSAPPFTGAATRPSSENPEPAVQSRPRVVPALDRLISAAATSGLAGRKGLLADDLYAMSAWLVAIGYGAPTIDQLVEDALRELEKLAPQERSDWNEIGEQLKRHT